MITWDEEKREKVIKFHGIDFARIKDIFEDLFAIDYDDFEHSDLENRRVIVAKSGAYGLVMAVYTADEKDIRFITARRAERWMERMYENQRNRY